MKHNIRWNCYRGCTNAEDGKRSQKSTRTVTRITSDSECTNILLFIAMYLFDRLRYDHTINHAPFLEPPSKIWIALKLSRNLIGSTNFPVLRYFLYFLNRLFEALENLNDFCFLSFIPKILWLIAAQNILQRSDIWLARRWSWFQYVQKFYDLSLCKEYYVWRVHICWVLYTRLVFCFEGHVRAMPFRQIEHHFSWNFYHRIGSLLLKILHTFSDAVDRNNWFAFL